jgi:hypothetical protein
MDVFVYLYFYANINRKITFKLRGCFMKCMHACMIERFYLFYSFFVYLTTVSIAQYITVKDDGMI